MESFRARLLEHRYAILLAALLLLLVGYPWLAGGLVGAIAKRLLWFLLLAAAVLSTGRHAGRLRLALLLGFAALTPRLIELVEGGDWSVSSSGLAVVLLVFVAWALLRDVLAHRRVTTETVNGALCVYLLAGLAWGELYFLLEQARPGALALAAPIAADATGGLEEKLVYFSFVTQATLGYGDVSPASGAARSLALGQAVFGQFYLAVLIARLVSLEIVHRTES